jgi:hypothetical protein
MKRSFNKKELMILALLMAVIMINFLIIVFNMNR